MKPYMLKIPINSPWEPTVTLQKVNFAHFQMAIAPKLLSLDIQLKSKKCLSRSNETIHAKKIPINSSREPTVTLHFWPFSNVSSS